MAKGARKNTTQVHNNVSKKYKKLGQEKRSGSQQKSPPATVRRASPTDHEHGAATDSRVGCLGTQTLQQQRAKHALEQVKLALHEGVDAKEFKSYASAFPAMIQVNGLGQAAAFYYSQSGTYRRLYKILSDWLRLERQPYFNHQDLLDGITSEDMHSYRIAQAEALLLLDWVKRFAKAFVRED